MTERDHTASIQQATQALKAKLANRPGAPAGTYKAPYTGPCSRGENCPDCQGTGWVRYDLPTWHSQFGRVQPCPGVHLWELPGAQQAYGLVASELEQLDWDYILPMGLAPQAAAQVKQVLDRGWGMVYLYGNHGQAKSLILKISIAWALRSGRLAAYANMADVIAHLQRAFDQDNPNSESENRLEWWQTLPILALDEFDRINPTKWATSAQFRLIDQRYVQAIRQESVTLVASNQAPENLDSYYRSRFSDGRFIALPLYAQDARPYMTGQDKF